MSKPKRVPRRRGPRGAADLRRAGVLLHPTSLPGRFPVGDLGPAAWRFAVWLADGGFRVWQILPLGPLGYADSPYGALSAFAGNPLLISPESLVADGLAAEGDLRAGDVPPSDHVDYPRATKFKDELLRAAIARFHAGPSENALGRDFQRFVRSAFAAPWLEDWALFAALKRSNGARPWWEWDAGARFRQSTALAEARLALAREIDFQRFVQFLFFRQWRALRDEAHRLGIAIFGDVPMYPALDSADVWAHPQFFALDAQRNPQRVAGVPPDYFSSTGQRWGNPVYRWDALRKDRYRWWIDRLRTQLEIADVLRLDHFRGFVGFWSIPAADATAEHGRWVRGPGAALLKAVRRELGALPFVAEDLGVITDLVVALRERFELPSTRVLQFGFSAEASQHAPHRLVPRSVVYTGTHDNATTRGWFDALGDDERRRVLAYLGATPETVVRALVRAALTSVSALALVPMQDLLELGGEARLNLPGRDRENWTWRIVEANVPGDLPGRLRELVAVSERSSPR